MLIEYIEEALKKAHYEMIEDEEPFYGEIPGFKGLWATGKTLEECRKNLKEVLEGWILLSIQKKLPLPKISPITRSELISRLRKFGFTGPFQGGKHQYM